MNVFPPSRATPIDAASGTPHETEAVVAPSVENRAVPMAEAGAKGILLPLPIMLALGATYFALWGRPRGKMTVDNVFIGLLSVSVFTLLGIVVHELIHGVTWQLLGRTPRGSIKYGFQWQTATPYAHCAVPIHLNAYRIGTAMPGILVGILPSIAGIVFGHFGLFLFGLFFTLAAGGDMLILQLLWDAPTGSKVRDHPTDAGCYLYPPGSDLTQIPEAKASDQG